MIEAFFGTLNWILFSPYKKFMSGDLNIASLMSELPTEAFHSDLWPINVCPVWIENAAIEDQYRAMKVWFLARYCDPRDATPYSSSDGKYVFVNGGPFRPEDVLFSKFGARVNDEVIQELVSDLENRYGLQWAPIRPDLDGDIKVAQEEYYDERFGIYVPDPAKPYSDLEARLEEISELLTLTGTQKAAQLARRVAYGATITALETYLWERLVYAVENDSLALESIVANVQHFKETNLKLSEVFDAHRDIETTVKAYLQGLVWHRWDKVAPLIKFGLRIAPPSFKPFVAPLVKRHDIVHRSGHDQYGRTVLITSDDLHQLNSAVKFFAQRVEELIAARDSLDLDVPF